MKIKFNHKENIIISIIVCTYNREKYIEQCLYSLMNQTFPKDQYEIIVVDDGSTDSTHEIVSKHPVKFIKHEINKGVAAARNTGLKNAKGNIYVCFDDDCYAEKDWLKNLVDEYNKYNLNEISGIAGIIKLRQKQIGIIEKYMDEIGYANPSPISYITSENLFMKFYSYLKNMLIPYIQTNDNILNVGEIWGANCSFPVYVLKAVNGWDENLSGAEDTDLCNRINKKFQGRRFICTKKAIIFHDHRLSLKGFLKKPYSRGGATLNFYLKIKKIPPIFPFPVAIVAFSLLFLVISPWYFLISILILPQMFYSWWLIKAIQKREVAYLTFAYLQSTYELSSILGLMKGYVTKI